MKVKQKKRNPYAFDPIMRKGGVHEKTNKAKRRKHKLQMQKEAANWQPYLFLTLLKSASQQKRFLRRKKALTA
ncbi:hypothetical protein MSP8887_00252 [Marinomonas spartinae]|uniref:hypothetical protein n=1 Tax=Marinomonas spartinae TaxID=1792290 RepID=UPI0008090C63|nr:hypothetical protein [Marinomonas spartinae]SBS25741.1 hypothetical protein MSP8887_00252 [Marinomonas spartinae]